MRPYPPTLREKRRYIHFEAVGTCTDKGVEYAINGSMLSLFGEDGYARANFSFVELENGGGICRCTHDWLDNTLAALAFVGEIDGKPAKIRVLEVSGTLRAVRKTKSF